MSNPSSRESKSGRKSQTFSLLSGIDQKLERAFKTIIGPGTSQGYQLAQFKGVLRELGFKLQDGQVSYPSVPGHTARLPEKAGDDPLNEAFLFIGKFFPEAEFHLPFILAKAGLLERLRKGGKLEPEPEYDDDGFISS